MGLRLKGAFWTGGWVWVPGEADQSNFDPSMHSGPNGVL